MLPPSSLPPMLPLGPPFSPNIASMQREREKERKGPTSSFLSSPFPQRYYYTMLLLCTYCAVHPFLGESYFSLRLRRRRGIDKFQTGYVPYNVPYYWVCGVQYIIREQGRERRKEMNDCSRYSVVKAKEKAKGCVMWQVGPS